MKFTALSFKNPCEHFCFKNLSDFLGPCFLLSDLKASGSQTGLRDLWPLRRLQQNLKYGSENMTVFSYISQRESVLFSRALIVWMLLLHRDVTADLFPAWKSEFLNVFWNLNDHKCRSWRCVGWCFLFFSLSVWMCSAQVSAVFNAACVCLLYVCVRVRRRPYVSVRWRVRCHGNRHMAAITCSEEEGPSQRGGEVVFTLFNHQSVSIGTTMLI